MWAMRRLAQFVTVLGVAASVLVGRLAHEQWRAPGGQFQSAWLPYALLAVLIVLVGAAAGIPDEPDRFGSSFARAAAAVLVSGAIAGLVLFFAPDLLPRFVVMVALAGSFVTFLTASWMSHAGRVRRRARERVLVVADGDELARFMEEALAVYPPPEQEFTVAGSLSAADATARLVDACTELDVTLLVLGSVAEHDEHVGQEALKVHAGGVRVRTMDAFYDEFLGKVQLAELGRMALLSDVGEVHGNYASVKRVIDLLAAVVGLVALAVVIPVVWIANLFGNRGPLFYRQQRVGLAGRTFTLVKFRSMEPGDASTWTVDGDPRITPFGRFLRRSHLDELPQMLNVLRGDLSMVGPRPEQPRYVAQLEDRIPHYQFRHVVTPGITGWAQVKFGYVASETEYWQKIQYDLWYVRHQSLGLDVRIMLRTVRELLGGKGT